MIKPDPHRHPPRSLPDRMRAGPVVLYFRGASLSREAEARAFVTALGGDGAGAARFVDNGENDNTGRDAIVAGMRSGAVGVIVSPSYQDLVYGFFVDETIRQLVKEHDVASADLFDPELLSPDFDRVHDLWDGEVAAWEPLLEGLAKSVLGDAAPASFCEELVAVSDDLAAWSERAAYVASSMRSEYVYSGLRSAQHLTTWVRNGLLISLPADDPAVLSARLDAIERRPVWEVVEHGRALLIDLRAHGDPALLHRALLVHAARCLEEGLWAEAEVTAEEARPFERNPAFPRRAERLSLAARLGRGDITSALAGLDALFLAERSSQSTAGPVLHSKRSFSELDEHEAVLRDLALSIQAAGDPSRLIKPLTTLCELTQPSADADQLRKWLAAQKPAAVKPPFDLWADVGRRMRERDAAQAPAPKKAASKKAASKKAASKKAASKKAASKKAASKKAAPKKT
ncbi:hypothetical protein [Nannocystis punicea]|uniref:TIR domain-containing protein n=1 Tax=Nannocystis punicea TaxID=2995304 RepID=A0ABY7GSZ5_9BACT|nr:hypothetical protein [Nannocystis poenicansa]WAS90049.1 hypothetical protein O0S08_27970 [Nannocystis poenicansa]